MLVLSRKTGQQICVPCCNVTIEVLRISGKNVRLGIRAPLDVAVHRREVLQRLGNRRKPAGRTKRSNGKEVTCDGSR